MARMRLLVEEAGVDLVVRLNESQTAAELLRALPVTSSAQTWGAEVYFDVPVHLGPEDPQATVELGAVGYWPPGHAVCLFFGQQPVSPVNLVGDDRGSIRRCSRQSSTATPWHSNGSTCHQVAGQRRPKSKAGGRQADAGRGWRGS